MSYPRMRPYPQQGAITIVSGEELMIPIGGSIIRVAQADQEFKIMLDSDVVQRAVLNKIFRMSEGDKFKTVTVINDSGVNLTFQLEIGEGDIETNDIAITGDISIKNANAPNDVLDVYNPNMLYSAQHLYEIRHMMSETYGRENSNLAPKTTLEGATHFTATNTTLVCISAADNTGGFIIRIASWCSVDSAYMDVLIDGFSLNPQSLDTNVVGGGIIQNIMVPAGLSVSIISSYPAGTINLWGEAL